MSRLLEKFRPENAWSAVSTEAGEKFELADAAHLFRRIGFGANWSELVQATEDGREKTIDRLLTTNEKSIAFHDEMSRMAKTVIIGKDVSPATTWWLYRMRYTPDPATEKMTLFWHGHFATSGAKVQEARLMLRQNELLRKYSMGRFEPMVQAIAQDAAMLLYLDSATNRKTKPNENFAREILELFCMGVGNYSEKDIQELARCFTGWEIQYGEYKFNPFQHDSGRKTLFGKSAKWEGDAAIRWILDQPATARFLCRKLVRYLVLDEPVLEDRWIEPLAAQLRESDYDFAPVIATVLKSQIFAASIGQKVRAPVELAIGFARSLQCNINIQALSEQLRTLGQLPLYPPNVKGWNGGREWINASTLLGRSNLIGKILANNDTRYSEQSLSDYLQSLGWKNGIDTVDGLVTLMLPIKPPGEVCKDLATKFDSAKDRDGAAKQLVKMIGSLPEFQLN